MIKYYTLLVVSVVASVILGRGAVKPSLSKRILVWTLVLALFAGTIWIDNNYIDPDYLYVEGVSEAFDGLSILVISDLHGKEFGKDNEKLLRQALWFHPDIIAITGDLIHDESQLSMVPALARGLSDIAPTYYVTGNHEWAAHCVPALKAILEEGGVTVLSNDYVLFERGGQKLALLGADDPNGPADKKTIPQLADEVRAKEGEDTFLLLLSHRNNLYETYAEAGIDLTLAGHAHGGIVRLPYTDGLIGPHREFLPDYTAGLYDLPVGQMFVSRGLGNQFPAIRINNPPHLPLVVLRTG